MRIAADVKRQWLARLDDAGESAFVGAATRARSLDGNGYRNERIDLHHVAEGVWRIAKVTSAVCWLVNSCGAIPMTKLGARRVGSYRWPNGCGKKPDALRQMPLRNKAELSRRVRTDVSVFRMK